MTGQAVATVDTALPVRPRAEVRVVNDPIAVLDTARFEHMQRIATVMAQSNLIPASLACEKGEDNQLVLLPEKVIMANCFLVVNQAVRWNMDPFAVAQCVSVVHGKLCYEGKLIAAVIQGKASVDLEYEISGQGDTMKVVVTGTHNGKPVLDSKGRPKIAEGTVGEWKTTGNGSPWSARGGHPRMLRYRGAREWCRIHEPGLMLGVYGEDEMDDLSARYVTRAVDDGGGPPNPTNDNDDGGGPPVPTEETTGGEAVGEDGGGPPVPEKEIISHPDNGESDARDRAEQVREELPADDGGIPEFLRVAVTNEKPARSEDEQQFLDELENGFGECTTMEELAETHRSLMAPWEGSIPTATWNAAVEIMDRHTARIQSAAG